jgi:hypothetical protein
MMISLSTNLAPEFEIRNGYCKHSHSNGDRCGYVVRQTKFDSCAHRDVAAWLELDAYAYSDALEIANIVRTEYSNGYAVIDRLYSCGCRVLG